MQDPALLATILIVEDEFLIANDLRVILEKAGYQVIGIAESAAEARAMVEQHLPAIVLLDIFLKGLETGIELAQWLRERNIPFVYLSANLTDSVLEAAKVTQPFGFLNKPFRERDVLTTLEIARYRHAHGEEARLRQQQGIQMAVNNAIITIQDRNQLCLAIAEQLNKLVPFTLLNLRISLPEEGSFYWLMLRKTDAGTFERIHLPALLGGVASDAVLEKAAREAPDQLGEQPGIFAGKAFDLLCRYYLTARASRDNFGIQSLALFPVVLKRRSVTNIHLASTAAHGFSPQDYAAVNLVIPQIALALDNLLACEEIDARRQIKTAELAVVSAFQNGKNIAAVVPQVAAAINALMPIDILSIYRVGRALGGVAVDAVVRKRSGQFELLPASEVALPPATTPQQWQGALATMESWLTTPALNVGEQADGIQEKNTVIKHYRELLGLRSSMHVPILIKSEPVAALIVASKAPYAFTQKDLQFLQELSTQIALALENLLAFERIKSLSEQLQQEKAYLNEELKTAHNFEQLIGTSPALRAVQQGISYAAASTAPVLLVGEIGTGKELIARAVHHASARWQRTMVKVECATLPPQLLDAELFGHESGSYAGAPAQRSTSKMVLAHGSTLFLDEIGDLPLDLQAKLLRLLRKHELERTDGSRPISIDVRIIAATTRNIPQEIAAGRFRADLYEQFSGGIMAVPALRERREDILPLARHLLQKIGKKLGKDFTNIADLARPQLVEYPWPGNVRELGQVLERGAILSPAGIWDLPGPLTAGHAPGAVRSLHEVMREAILAALAQSNNRIRGQGGAAELLNIKPTTLEARMKKLRIGPVRADS